MKAIIWKIRFVWHIRRLLRVPWGWCWEMAGANLESIMGDLAVSPREMAEEESDAWLASC